MNSSSRSPHPFFAWTLVVALAGCKAGTGEEGSSSGEASETGETGETGDIGTTGDLQPVCTDKAGEPGVLQWERSGLAYDDTVNDAVLTTTVALDIVHAGSRGGKMFVEAVDANGGPRWSVEHAGEGARDTWPLDAAADATGAVHILAYEWVDKPGLDGRLLVLRYSPGGVFEWRWERPNPPAVNSGSYMPRGAITVTGEEIHVVEVNTGGPIVLLRLDTSQTLLAETSLATPTDFGNDVRPDFAPDGAPVVATLGWIGRFTRDGDLVWSDDPGELRPAVVVAGRDGDAFMVGYTFSPSGHETSLRHYTGDGSVAWTTPLPPVTVYAGARGGADCDTALLLGGGLPNEAYSFEDLWVGGFADDGTPLWEFAPVFAEPDSHGAALNLAVTHEGDAAILGYYAHGMPGMIESFPWLARVSGD